MKKTYTKPEILFESFSFSGSIAGDCEVIVPTPNSGTCGYQPEGLNYKIFINGVSECMAGQVINDDVSNGFCYHNPITTNNLFNS